VGVKGVGKEGTSGGVQKERGGGERARKGGMGGMGARRGWGRWAGGGWRKG